jgi:nitrogen fixation NifU-like protein
MTDVNSLYPSFYSPKVMEHIRHPQNLGEMINPDGRGTEGNPICGDVMRLFIKVGKKKGKDYIKDIKFQTLGCGAAIASSSMLTAIAKGKTLEEAGKITRQAVAKALGGLPPVKIHCSVLAVAALKKAIKDYRQKNRV